MNIVGPTESTGTAGPTVCLGSPVRVAFSTLAFPGTTLVYLQVKDALAATGQVVPAGRGDGQLREMLGALRDSGFTGFMSLEPHLARAGRYGGFSGPEGFRQASQALKFLLNEQSITWQ